MITAAPVGHQGVRVDITERPAITVSGWFGVIVFVALGLTGDRRRDRTAPARSCSQSSPSP